MKNKGLNYLGWLIIVIVAFWGGRLTAPEKIRIEKISGIESRIYELEKIPLNAITVYLGVQGLDILPKNEVERIKNEAHIIWQSGYKTGYNAGYDNGYKR